MQLRSLVFPSVMFSFSLMEETHLQPVEVQNILRVATSPPGYPIIINCNNNDNNHHLC